METGDSFQSGGILYDWILQKVAGFMEVLNTQLPRLPDRLGSVLGQSMVCSSTPSQSKILWTGVAKPSALRAVSHLLTHGVITGQHFAMSLGRHGVDFRGLLPPLFEEAALRQYRQKIEQATTTFCNALPSASLTTHSLASNRQPVYDGTSPSLHFR